MKALVLFLLGGAGVVVACSDSLPPAASDGAGGASSSSSSASGTAIEAGVDAASITPRPDLCEGVVLGGDPVEEIRYFADPIAPIGGDLEQGTYDLVTATNYVGKDAKDASSEVVSQPSGNIVRSTLVVGEFSFQLLTATATGDVDEDGGTGTPEAKGYLYRTFDVNLINTLVCPSTALPVAFGYSAAPNGIAFYPDATHRWLYQRRAEHH